MKRIFLHGAWIGCAVFAAVSAGAAPRSVSYVPGQVIVKLKPQAGATDAAVVRAALSATVKTRFADIGAEVWDVGGVAVTDAVERLQRDPRVEFVEPNYVLHADQLFPNDPRFAEQWGLHNAGQPAGKADADIDAPEAWTGGTGGAVLIGVIDSGIELNHPDLKNNLFTNPGEIPSNGVDDDGNGYVDDVHGWDFVNDDNDPDDDSGHGTHVGGIIAASGGNAVGVTGVCWSARMLPLKFLDETGSGATSDAILAIQYAVRMGAKVANASWGSFFYSSALRAAIHEAGEHGLLLITASGNDALDNELHPHYPSDYDLDNIISVTSTDRNDALSFFADYGAQSVDLGAPGYDVLSTFPGGRYVRLAGTSMSCAFVSGAACLLWSRAPLMTAGEVKSSILASVDRLPSLAGKTVTGGRLNLRRMVSSLDAVAPAAVSNLSVEATASNSARLAWSAPGDDGANGIAARYDLRSATSPINAGNFGAATRVVNLSHPGLSGTAETVEVKGLFFSTKYYFALVVEDEMGNRSLLSNVASATTLGVPRLDYSSDSFSASLKTGGTLARQLTIGNSGNGTLDFSVPVSPLWVRLVPASGRIAAGQSLEVQVWFDAARMAGGSYGSSVIVATNDPSQSNLLMTVALQVTDAADIAVGAAALDFGSVFVGTCGQRDVLITNHGTVVLLVSSVSAGAPPFVAGPSSFLLGPNESRSVPVFFCPDATGKMTGSLSVNSNDPDHPEVLVSLRGKAVSPPLASLLPPSLSANLFPGATAHRTLSLSNAGGSTLDYVVSVTAAQPDVVDALGGTPAAEVIATARPLSRDALQELRAPASTPREAAVTGAVDRGAPFTPRAPRFAQPAPAGSVHLEEVFGSDANLFFAGPRMRGNLFTCTTSTNLKEYRFYLNPTVSTEMWFLVYESTSETGLYGVVGASVLTPTTSGFGWYSSGEINVPLVAGRYYMMVAAFQDVTGYYNQRPIAPYPIPASFGSLTAAAGWTWSPTVYFPPPGFQDVPPEAFGEPVAYYQTIVTDGVVPWLSVAPESGSVRRAQSADIDVRIDATGLSGGDYDANLRIRSNDPATPDIVVPVHLHVSDAPDITMVGGPVDFGECFVGTSASDTLVVSNTGTLTLNVTGVASNNAAFTVAPGAFSLAPGASAPLVVKFKPAASGHLSATLTVNSNDPDESAVALALGAEGRRPPRVGVSTGSLSEIVAPGKNTTKTFTIVNSGESALSFEFVVEKAGASGATGGKLDPTLEGRGTSARGSAMAPAAHSYSGHQRGSRAGVVVLRDSPPASAHGIRVLILKNDDNFEILDLLSAYPDVARVDEFDVSGITPTLTLLAGYDAVLVINDLSFPDPAATGDVLANYVDGGGAVIMTLAAFISGYELGGRFITDGYSPFTIGTGPSGSAVSGAYDSDHPIMAGVGIVFGDLLGVTTLTPGARSVADWGDGRPFIATQKQERVVGMNVLLIDGGYWAGDIPLLLHNALRWVTGVRWLRATPERGVVPANRSVQVALKFDALDLSSGNHSALLRITHNDPLAGDIVIPVALSVDSTVTVTGAGALPMPARYALEPNRPNPFNPATSIGYDLPQSVKSRLVVYDVNGVQVRELVDAKQPAGHHTVTWDGRSDAGAPVASGVYFYRLKAGAFMETRKMVLLK